jgi:hypothetical protein
MSSLRDAQGAHHSLPVTFTLETARARFSERYLELRTGVLQSQPSPN